MTNAHATTATAPDDTTATRNEKESTMTEFLKSLQNDGWAVSGTVQIPGRREERVDSSDLPLGPGALRYLRSCFPAGVFRHQHEALSKMLRRENVCLSTGTASGKSAFFYASALHILESEPRAIAIAMYPQKALGAEQAARWRSAIEASGIPASVGVVNGDVSQEEGWRLLKKCRVLVMTPDILHARVLPNLKRPEVISVLKRLRLLIADEVHEHTGVFGSHSAYLFRRIQNVVSLAGGRLQVAAASATIRNAPEHLKDLFGLEFSEIGADRDTSPRHPIHIHLVRPPASSSVVTETSKLVASLLADEQRHLIAFGNTRDEVERISSDVLRRLAGGQVGSGSASNAPSVDDLLTSAPFLPYRAGYEKWDREHIQCRLTSGSLRGVVSTSALELGMDIPHLDTGVLLGVPSSSTSFWQRIGRIGRKKPGEVFVIWNGKPQDIEVFSAPARLLDRPPAEGALYLGNQQIQYINALCLARPGGEHAQACEMLGLGEDREIESSIAWPNGFLDLCRLEVAGEVPQELETLKAVAGDQPNRTFSMRSAEPEFEIQCVVGGQRQRLGDLSFSQVMRTAYPGAIYRHLTKPYRVWKVNLKNRTVIVNQERKAFSTRPSFLPTAIYPNLKNDSLLQARRHGSTRIIECRLQVREAVSGYVETLGRNERTVTYATTRLAPGPSFSDQVFARNYFTTGVLLAHPMFLTKQPFLEEVGKVLLEAYFQVAPFEREELSHAAGKFRSSRGPIMQDDKFVAIFDRTYGSLRLSSRMLDEAIWPKVATKAADLATNGQIPAMSLEALQILAALAVDAASPAVVDSDFGTQQVTGIPNAANLIPVILPGSIGLNLRSGNSAFHVEGIFFSPELSSLAYRGHSGSTPHANASEIYAVKWIVPSPGQSSEGFYDTTTGLAAA